MFDEDSSEYIINYLNNYFDNYFWDPSHGDFSPILKNINYNININSFINNKIFEIKKQEFQYSIFEKSDNSILKRNINDIFNKYLFIKNIVIKEKEIKKEKNIKNEPSFLNVLSKKRRRKYSADDIKNKLINRFFKKLTKQLNKMFKSFGIGELKDLPCIFFKEIINNDFTLKDIFSTTPMKEIKKFHEKKYTHNLELLNSLKNIYKKLFDIFENVKFSQIFSEYLDSTQFEEDINGLEFQPDEDMEDRKNYIENYISKAKKLKNLFCKK